MENIFGKRLKELREGKEFSQTKLAKELNVDQTKISKIELGKLEPNLDFIVTIAKYFNVTTDYLLGLENDF